MIDIVVYFVYYERDLIPNNDESILNSSSTTVKSNDGMRRNREMKGREDVE